MANSNYHTNHSIQQCEDVVVNRYMYENSTYRELFNVEPLLSMNFDKHGGTSYHDKNHDFEAYAFIPVHTIKY